MTKKRAIEMEKNEDSFSSVDARLKTKRVVEVNALVLMIFRFSLSFSL